MRREPRLKGKDFFGVKENPLIILKSPKMQQSGPDSIEVDGNSTIRGVTKPAKLTNLCGFPRRDGLRRD